MEDFLAHSREQLLELGKYDALDKLVHSLLHIIDNLDEATLSGDEYKDKNIVSDTKMALVSFKKKPTI